MSTAAEEEQKANDRARQDLSYVMELKDSDAFNLYYMRRLRQKQAEVEKDFKYSKMDGDEREALRLLNIHLEKLLTLIDEDETTLKNQLGRSGGGASGGLRPAPVIN